MVKKISERNVEIKDNQSGYSKKTLLKTFMMPNGFTENFFVDKDSNSVQIFAMTDDGYVICVKQFRPSVEKELVELPGGGIEENEKPFEAAYRELKEETGYEPGELIYINSINYSPYSSGLRHMFLAKNCKKVSTRNLDPNEFVKVQLWKLDVFRAFLKKGLFRGTDHAYICLDMLNLL